MQFDHIQVARTRVAIILILVALLLTTTIVLAQSGGDFSLTQWAINNGGGESAAGAFTVNATLGQPNGGSSMEGGQFRLTGGFGTAEKPGVPPPTNEHSVYLPTLIKK